jgi:RHS repeat-associated protein
MPDAFDFRFSSEYFDSETGLVYYNFRYYSPELGRWLSRDPIGESGGENLYGMLDNDTINYWDWLGFGFFGDPETPSGVYATPAPCPKCQTTEFIQILWGGYGSYKWPKVDVPGVGFGTSTKEKRGALYPRSIYGEGTFQDNPKGFTGPVQFEVCRVCIDKCSGKIVSVGPCVKWKKGDSGDLDFKHGSKRPSKMFEDTVDKEYPDTLPTPTAINLGAPNSVLPQMIP